jgi:hypothetical protein
MATLALTLRPIHLPFPRMAMFGKPSEQDDARELTYRHWLARQHPLALPALLLSAFSLTHFGTLWIDEIAGIVLGVFVLVKLSRARWRETDAGDVRLGGDWLAWGAVLIGSISLTIAIAIYFVLPARR